MMGAALVDRAAQLYWIQSSSAFFTYRDQALPLLTGSSYLETALREVLVAYTALHDGQVRIALPLFTKYMHINAGIPNFSVYISNKLHVADLLSMQGKLATAAEHYQEVLKRTQGLLFPASEARARWGIVLLECSG